MGFTGSIIRRLIILQHLSFETFRLIVAKCITPFREDLDHIVCKLVQNFAVRADAADGVTVAQRVGGIVSLSSLVEREDRDLENAGRECLELNLKLIIA